jgi:hypothetical protein
MNLNPEKQKRVFFDRAKSKSDFAFLSDAPYWYCSLLYDQQSLSLLWVWLSAQRFCQQPDKL